VAQNPVINFITSKIKAVRLIIPTGKPINPEGISVGPPVVPRHELQRTGRPGLSKKSKFAILGTY